MTEIISYQPEGTCASQIEIEIEIEDRTVVSVKFAGGCPGSLTGLCELIKGMPIEDVLKRIEGVKCGGKDTSCPDQLARALRGYLKSHS